MPLMREKGPGKGTNRDYETTRRYALAALTVVDDYAGDQFVKAIDFHRAIELETSGWCVVTDNQPDNERIKAGLDGVFTDGLHLGSRVLKLHSSIA